MEYVKSFKDLEVYKLSRQLAKDIFEVSKKFLKKKYIFLLTRSGDHLVQLELK